jgi:hypothetical protein
LSDEVYNLVFCSGLPSCRCRHWKPDVSLLCRKCFDCILWRPRMTHKTSAPWSCPTSICNVSPPQGSLPSGCKTVGLDPARNSCTSSELVNGLQMAPNLTLPQAMSIIFPGWDSARWLSNRVNIKELEHAKEPQYTRDRCCVNLFVSSKLSTLKSRNQVVLHLCCMVASIDIEAPVLLQLNWGWSAWCQPGRIRCSEVSSIIYFHRVIWPKALQMAYTSTLNSLFHRTGCSAELFSWLIRLTSLLSW